MLQSSVILIVLGEILSYALNYFGVSGTSAFSDFTSGLLLGLSVGMKLIGIILIIIYIARDRKEEEKK